MANRTTRTPKKDEVFIASLRDGASVSRACLEAGIGRSSVYEWREDDAEFAKAWDDAVEEGTDRLEDEAYRRARDGTSKPVYQGGKRVGVVQEHSDTLMIFLLKGRRRSKYGDKQEHTGRDGAPIQVDDISDERRRAALALLLGRK